MPSKKEMAALQAKHDALEAKVNTLTKEKGTLTKDLAAANKAKDSVEGELESSKNDAGKHRGTCSRD